LLTDVLNQLMIVNLLYEHKLKLNNKSCKSLKN